MARIITLPVERNNRTLGQVRPSYTRIERPTLHPGSYASFLQAVADVFPDYIYEKWMPTGWGNGFTEGVWCPAPIALFRDSDTPDGQLYALWRETDGSVPIEDVLEQVTKAVEGFWKEGSEDEPVA